MKPTPHNRKALLFLFLFCGVISFIIWLGTQNIKKEDFIWFRPFRISYLVNQVNRDTNRGTQEVLEKIRQKLAVNTGLYGIVVYRLEDKVWYGINEDVEFKGASILKVPIMISAFQEGLEKTYGEYTGKQLVFAMGKYSDNDATTTLADGLGRDKIQAEIKNMGMINTSFADNSTTPMDVVEMWKDIYKKPEIWESFQDSIFEDRITPSLDPDIRLIHKVGTDDGVWADSGIVQHPTKPYILVILNKDIKREEAEKTVPEIAEIIVNYEAEYARQKLPPPASPERKLK
ncbi:serine hydrolase [Candidatus Amesbacteria bacterium]|nr:serine hydrolase [Candidatus Amesbacteria bacterium]